MIKGLSASSAGMRPKMLAMEVLANNLANISTTGFKRDEVFAQILKESADKLPSGGSGDLEGVSVERYTDFTEGALKETNNPLDVAIEGRGFFAVETPHGVRYTRTGRFSLSTEGTIMTTEGFPVLGKNGAITLPDRQKMATADISISQHGEVSVGKQVIAQMRIADFDDMTQLKKETATLFSTDAKERIVNFDVNQTSAIRQGALEESNVNGLEEMVEMIELTRSFESNQKAVQTQDNTLEKALEVGKL